VTGKIPTSRKQFDELVKPIDGDLIKRRVTTALAILGGVFAIFSVLSWLWPDDAKTDPTPGNSSIPSSTLVTGFARDYVTTYLTAKSGDEHTLTHYVTLKDIKLPAVAGEFTDTDIAFAKQAFITKDDVAVWTVIVSGIVNGNTTATPQRTFYRVPITVLDGAPRATALPMQVAGPGLGVDFRLGYRHTVSSDSALGTTAAGFVRSYLTGGADFARYVTANSSEKPIHPAPYAKVDTLKIDANVGADGSAATTAEVYVTVAARTKNYAMTQLGYPLTLRSIEGRWQVVSIAATPQLQLQPDAPNEKTTPTTTSSTPPPPPTRG
jgi:hypothetical protein